MSRRTSRPAATTPDSGRFTAFTTGLAAAAALTAGTGLLLYTGLGFLRTAGMLVGICIGAIAAALWAGDDASGSTRPRAIAAMLAFLAADVFTAYWSASEPLRQEPFGGALAVLFILALPAYATGALLAGLQRHTGQPAADGDDGLGTSIGVAALAGAAIGVVLTTTVLVGHYNAWVVYFGAAAVMLPAISYPVRRSAAAAGPRRGGIMENQVVIVTGVDSAGQVGFAVAKRFIDAGARVLVTGLTDDVRALAEQLGPRGASTGLRADLTRDDDIAAVIAAAQQHGRLDALINIAGGLSVIADVSDTTPEDFRQEMSRNAETMLRLSRASLPLLRASRGCIVNFTSPAAELGAARLGAYTAAKAAVTALTRALALEEATNGVRVNAIAPGLIDTEQNRATATSETRFVGRDQVADAVLFLASPQGSGVTGEVLHVMADGLMG